MPNILDQIMSRTLLTVMDRKATANLPAMERAAAAHTPRGFQRSLRRVATQGPAIIAELKKASPSRGVMRNADYKPVQIARSYESVGAAALSVLTDEEFFKGSLADLQAVADAVKIPVLRKDFILDPFQILEARAAGADAVLLIVGAHKDSDLRELYTAARRMNLDVLVEVHSHEELDRAIGLGAEMIGVNSRDLTTMTTDPKVHMDLVRRMPTSCLRVAESGIRSAGDVERLLEAGYDAFLVGEALMRQPDPAAMLAMLLEKEYAADFYDAGTQLA
jgi:indole-3-glycerol phosphate synthase